MRYGRWGVSFSPSETAEAGRIARSLGGYDEMLRLERDLAGYQRRGIPVRMVTDADGRRQLVPAAPASPQAPSPAPLSSPAPAQGILARIAGIIIRRP